MFKQPGYVAALEAKTRVGSIIDQRFDTSWKLPSSLNHPLRLRKTYLPSPSRIKYIKFALFLVMNRRILVERLERLKPRRRGRKEGQSPSPLISLR